MDQRWEGKLIVSGVTAAKFVYINKFIYNNTLNAIVYCSEHNLVLQFPSDTLIKRTLLGLTLISCLIYSPPATKSEESTFLLVCSSKLWF